MRRTLSTIVLALGLVFTVVPAWADDVAGSPPPPCTSTTTAGTPCTPVAPPSCSTTTAGQACTPDPCQTALESFRAQVTSQRTTIDRQAQRIARQAKLIKRLRHQLAAR